MAGVPGFEEVGRLCQPDCRGQEEFTVTTLGFLDNKNGTLATNLSTTEPGDELIASEDATAPLIIDNAPPVPAAEPAQAPARPFRAAPARSVDSTDIDQLALILGLSLGGALLLCIAALVCASLRARKANATFRFTEEQQ